jgi:hypothetical protein
MPGALERALERWRVARAERQRSQARRASERLYSAEARVVAAQEKVATREKELADTRGQFGEMLDVIAPRLRRKKSED